MLQNSQGSKNDEYYSSAIFPRFFCHIQRQGTTKASRIDILDLLMKCIFVDLTNFQLYRAQHCIVFDATIWHASHEATDLLAHAQPTSVHDHNRIGSNTHSNRNDEISDAPKFARLQKWRILFVSDFSTILLPYTKARHNKGESYRHSWPVDEMHICWPHEFSIISRTTLYCIRCHYLICIPWSHRLTGTCTAYISAWSEQNRQQHS